MKTIIAEYNSLRDIHSKETERLKRKFHSISLLRLLIAIASLTSLYYIFTYSAPVFLPITLGLAAIFLALLKLHNAIAFRRALSSTLATINANEVNHLTVGQHPYPNGHEYIDTNHPYSYDIDLFGENSLFQSLNRTGTYIGKSRLANLFLSRLTNQEIENNQDALQELSGKLPFRQKVFALTLIANDRKETYEKLLDWSQQKQNSTLGWLTHLLSYLLPISLMVCIMLYFFTSINGIPPAIRTLFIVNLLVLASQLKTIKRELTNTGRIDDIVRGYSRVIECIEEEDYNCEKLVAIRTELGYGANSSSKQIRKLSGLLGQLDSIGNPLGAILINGFLLYHLHVLRKLQKWRRIHAHKVMAWLNAMGEIETLSSLANYSYNNPNFCYPTLNQEQKIEFTNLGHPLINEKDRVVNSVQFYPHRFIVLTGSNMSGKSTFLRSLGVNMVLAGIGAPVCATAANVHPLDVWVSMRVTDSLVDHESYFFAEVKRLKAVMDATNGKVIFVLLDEILRGTNSDDKRFGTIEIIKRLVDRRAIGALATHDLEVCTTTTLHPNYLTNKCFEVDIVGQNLKFDYKLREGVCQSKNATFFMRKTGII